ncbi:MAG: helix-turn-helix domain-containing protein [Spirochaeta sp.]|nr:helix-turn-helix domain-containing protein [Spirochaeta sp.]
MESVGAKLKNHREEKGYSLEQVVRETHIARRYITALESEAFDEFPAESYLLGFLRNYSQFLDLEPQEMVQLYRNIRLQEQPAPIEELIHTPSRRAPVTLIAAIVVAVLLIAGGAFFGIRMLLGRNAEAAPVAVAGEEYAFSNDFLEQRFGVGDSISLNLNGESYSLIVVSSDNALLIESPGETLSVTDDVEASLDVTGDGRPDLRVLVRNAQLSGDRPSAVIRFDRQVASPSGAASVGSGPAEAGGIGLPLGDTNVASRRRQPQLVVEREQEQSYELRMSFIGPTMLRYLTADGDRVERWFGDGEQFELTQEDEVRFWLSNAGGTNLEIDGRSLSLGESGEVVAFQTRWVADGNTQRLELHPVY